MLKIIQTKFFWLLMALQPKVLIVTATTTENRFPENFSCWYAGALEAKRCSTMVEIIPLNFRADPIPSTSIMVQEEKFKRLYRMLPTIKQLILILPTYNDMIPIAIKSFVQILTTKKKFYAYKLVTIDTMPETYITHHTHFTYPLYELDSLLGLMLYSNRTQFQCNPSGNMCALFAERHDELHALIQQTLTICRA